MSSRVPLPSAQPLMQSHPAASAFLRFFSLMFSLWLLPLSTNLGKLGGSRQEGL